MNILSSLCKKEKWNFNSYCVLMSLPFFVDYDLLAILLTIKREKKYLPAYLCFSSFGCKYIDVFRFKF